MGFLRIIWDIMTSFRRLNNVLDDRKMVEKLSWLHAQEIEDALWFWKHNILVL